MTEGKQSSFWIWYLIVRWPAICLRNGRNMRVEAAGLGQTFISATCEPGILTDCPNPDELPPPWEVGSTGLLCWSDVPGPCSSSLNQSEPRFCACVGACALGNLNFPES